MELSDFFRICRRESRIVLGIPLIALIVSLIVLARQPTKFETATTLTLTRSTSLNQAEVPFYLYDNYYAIQSSGFIADTVLAWFNSPAIMKEIYDRAEISTASLRPKQLIRTFRARKIIPANVELVTSHSDQATGEALIRSATGSVTERIQELSKAGEKSGGGFTVFAEEPITTEANKPYRLVAVGSLLVGLLAGVMLALGKHYIKR